ncbi:MAG: hypothetical protein EBZ77_14435, partial [Chitinophagia bacterium]|nr:hypothetical protein [Chitinophagia bacterium]
MVLACSELKAQVRWISPTGQAWLTRSNWSGSRLPGASDTAQFDVNPTSATTGVGINMDTASGSVTVGVITVSSARTNNLIIGNSSPTTSGILHLNGDTLSGYPNVVLANMASNAARLTLQHTQGAGASTLSLNFMPATATLLTGAGTATAVGNTIALNIPVGGYALQMLGNGTWDASSARGVNGGCLRLAATNTFANGLSIGLSDGTQSGLVFLDSATAIRNVTGNDIVVNRNSQLVLSASTSAT